MIWRAILTAGAALALVGCATETSSTDTASVESEQVDPRRGEEVNRICFASNIDGFSETTRTTVVVREGRDHFLIETFGACDPSLDHAISIAFDTFSGCVTRGDDIIAFDSLSGHSHGGIGPRSCKIKRIYAWDPDAAEDTEEGDEDDAEEAASEA
ncbi:MAG: DUF6491 family protein [Henriciella sp.]|nr:DUF6491 family protein [Henriciella sp.]